MTKKKKWSDLGPRSRRLIVIGAVFEGVLKTAALADLVRRPSDEVRGSKGLWAAVIVLANSVGVVPVVYFTWGRRKR